MKIVIDISKDRYDEIMAMDWKNCRRFFDEEIRAIHDGKAIEQEPCTDAISRQAVLERAINAPIAKVVTEDKVIYRKIVFADEIENIPPVTPAQKTGYWIIVNERAGVYRCSVCNELSCCSSFYCHNCGTKMEVEG